MTEAQVELPSIRNYPKQPSKANMEVAFDSETGVKYQVPGMIFGTLSNPDNQVTAPMGTFYVNTASTGSGSSRLFMNRDGNQQWGSISIGS